MKNVTLSAEDQLVEQARRIAHSRHKTLNAEFREWLVAYTSQNGNAESYSSLMSQLSHVNSGGKYTRDQMNER